jgi:transcriptional regulator with XRE-family HTH domain
MITKSYFEKLEKKYGVMTFADMLRAWREAEEMSQTAFAKKVGLSVQNLNDLEKGRRIPSPSRAAKIAKRLGSLRSLRLGVFEILLSAPLPCPSGD